MSSRRRRLDTRTLRPRDYLADPWTFGRQVDAVSMLPARGDRHSLEVALVQHHVAALIRSVRDPNIARSVTERFGFSKQYWSRCLTGHAWMGETVFAGSVWAVLDLNRRRLRGRIDRP